MHQVAEFLSCEAKGQKKPVDADAFARSAFNRYYYATFLSVRKFVAELDADWGRGSHSGLPDLLEGAVLKNIRNQAKKLAKQKAIAAPRVYAIMKQASQASSEIASILRIAYNVRVVADYKPEQLVLFNHADFALADHTRAEARNWKTRVDQAIGVLLGISKELGLV